MSSKKTTIDRLSLISANTWLDGIETRSLFSDSYAHERLRDNLKQVAGDFDFCFIDIPPSFNWLCKSAFYTSDYSLICAIPEPFSILAMQRLQTYHVEINRKHKIEVAGVLLSFWDERGSINQALIHGIEIAFEGKIFNTKIRRDKAIPKAVLDGVPVFMTEKNSRASEDYQNLAIEFLDRLLKYNIESKKEEYVDSKR